MSGSVIHQVETNKMIASENEKITQKNGEQKPENFEGGFNEVLYSSLSGGNRNSPVRGCSRV